MGCGHTSDTARIGPRHHTLSEDVSICCVDVGEREGGRKE